MQHSRPILTYKHSIFFPATYFLYLHFLHPRVFMAVLLFLLLSLPLLIYPGFFNGMSELFEPDAMNYATLSRFIMWILSVPRNPTSTRLPLSGSLVTLFRAMIALTAGRPFFLPITSTPVVMSIFLSGRVHLF